ncbi:P-loop containing nucleoside triphosphate hydrolase protein [Cutaneotrichosporon oleaginosum]|uniref:p-loop containing nucleoside triphosphate hydrolase protein n=1 Tax=Cutaneotrichosporon oleaginosum TaxID=879819 RepID=A0A0J0XMW4_9TREE|nr:P-loop containing nucleoside triphosphate hydrolase protein [Cutaneotrichosporon oleaginosum]KLT42428.1 P-loop containing nucleoside triphosphate hydrolase protein [Cutaneotrichosporon oleaginosum]TXT06947.1 hypothetical protein COLE_06278 [Cutaneotrichosporon oleaginosum]
MTVAQHIRYKAERIAAFITAQRKALKEDRPLLVSMQGPQGCGKSTLAAELVNVLGDQGIKCAVASMDDFYLTHAGLKAVAAAHPNNAMLQGRGPPGTHDLPLLADVLRSLRARPPSRCNPLFLPTFDKSLHGGEGDRGPLVPLKDKLDVFVLEGWSLGYGPLPEAEARKRWSRGATASTHDFEAIQTLNKNLAEVEVRIGGFFDAHVCVTPLDFAFVYEWRTEQEHRMKEKNGGRGMSDEQVRKFVDRYMPTYEVFGDVRPQRETLTVTFNKEREIVDPKSGEEGHSRL